MVARNTIIGSAGNLFDSGGTVIEPPSLCLPGKVKGECSPALLSSDEGQIPTVRALTERRNQSGTFSSVELEVPWTPQEGNSYAAPLSLWVRYAQARASMTPTRRRKIFSICAHCPASWIGCPFPRKRRPREWWRLARTPRGRLLDIGSICVNSGREFIAICQLRRFGVTEAVFPDRRLQSGAAPQLPSNGSTGCRPSIFLRWIIRWKELPRISPRCGRSYTFT